jgi:hypothetical protein
MHGKRRSGIEKREQDPELRHKQQERYKIKLPDFTDTYHTISL